MNSVLLSFIFCSLIYAGTIQKNIEDYIQNLFLSRGTEPEIEEIEIPVIIPAGKIEFNNKNIDYDKLGKQNIKLELFIDGKYYCDVSVKLKLSKEIFCLVAKSDIKLGEKLTEDNLVMENKRIEKNELEYFNNFDSVVDLVAKQMIPKGNIIEKKFVTYPIIIESGKKIMMIYKTPTLEIRSYGIAKRRGKLGDIIPIRNISSGKVISGRIVSENSILVGE